jgi:hypothetical protein
MQIEPSEIQILFQSTRLPTGVTGLPGAAKPSTSGRYESTVTLSGGLSGRFKGSIYPDNMNVKGRLLNGTYDVFLGFHKPGHPTKHDLKVRTNGFRPVLVVNGGRPIPVSSFSPTKKTSDGIHIHNGYYHWTTASPMSEGCLIIAPNDWTAFLSKFLQAFPSIDDWSTNGSRVGRKIGTVTVSSVVHQAMDLDKAVMMA